MIKISVIYIGIVVVIAALIAGVPMVMWGEDTAEKVSEVANRPIASIIAPGQAGSGQATSDRGAAPQAALPVGLEQATAAILQDLARPAGAPAAPAADAAPAPVPDVAAAVAAAVAAEAAPEAPPSPAREPAARNTSGDLSAIVASTASQEELEAMSGVALSGLRQLRGKTLASLDGLVSKALADRQADPYMQALLAEAAR